jgi:penicillin-binding protein 2
MTEPAIFFNEVNERQGVFHRRAFIMGGVVTAGLFALGGRLAELQIIENNRYKTLATANQYNFRLVPPPRGRIVDRNGVELASNRPNFRLLLLKDQVDDVDQTLDAAAQLIPIAPDKRRQLSRQIENGQAFVPVVLAEDLSWDEFARLNVRTPELQGLQADMGEARTYPFGGAFAHVVGYVSKVTDATLKAAGPNPDPLLLNPGFRIGKQGVEKALDLDLRGKAGGQKVEVDAKGKVVREDPLGDIKPVPGKTIELTLDADIQNKALQVFGTESGAAVMMDCRNGDILCMLSAPSFDANRFVTGLSGAEYQALTQYDHKPLLNKALTATYPPGSTFKTMVALAALENGYDPRTVHVCGKSWPWGGRVWHRHLLRHLFLPVRPLYRPGQDRRHRPQVRPGRDPRHRHSGPEGRPYPGHRLQAPCFPARSGLAPRRDPQHGHRPGLCERQRPAIVRAGRAAGQWRQGDQSAPDPFHRRRRPAFGRRGAGSAGRQGACRFHPLGDGRGDRGRWHGRRGGSVGPRRGPHGR